MVKKPVVGSDLPDPPDNERLYIPPMRIRSLGHGYWTVESEEGPVMTEAGDGLCIHELSELVLYGRVTVCDTCGVDA